MKKRKRKTTKTASFGSPGRVSHDSSEFYDSSLYKNLGMNVEKKVQYLENPLPESALDKIFHHTGETMTELPDHSVHLMVTSPPYNVSKEYDEDLSLDEYRGMLRRVFAETYRALVTGGRACVNVANLGRKPYVPLHAYIVEDMLSLGFLMRGEIIWNKSASAGASTAWGSWKSPSNPCLRDVHEYILIFCKDSFKRKPPADREKTITKEEFLGWTKSVWDFPTVSAKKVGHPAPFPVELPHRLIQLYTFKDETVLDPFCGSGASCLAAAMDQRHYVGYDINEEYVERARKRIEEAMKT